jgi:hypothetical protein
MRVLRFDNRQVLTETDAVVDTIFRVLTEPLTLTLSPEGEGVFPCPLLSA